MNCERRETLEQQQMAMLKEVSVEVHSMFAAVIKIFNIYIIYLFTCRQVIKTCRATKGPIRHDPSGEE
jgi:hypothetical protein